MLSMVLATLLWAPSSQFPENILLWSGGTVIGGWSVANNTYRAWDGQTWGEVSAPPIAPPQANYGVDEGKLHSPRYVVNGVETDRAAAVRAIGKSNLTDDSTKLRVTLIGSEAACEAAAAVVPRDRFHVQQYRPDHFRVRQCGFVATGTPTVYVQHPDGRVIHRQDDARGLEAALAKAYDPVRDPDLRKPNLPDFPWYVWAGGAALLYLLLKKEEK